MEMNINHIQWMCFYGPQLTKKRKNDQLRHFFFNDKILQFFHSLRNNSIGKVVWKKRMNNERKLVPFWSCSYMYLPRIKNLKSFYKNSVGIEQKINGLNSASRVVQRRIRSNLGNGNQMIWSILLHIFLYAQSNKTNTR